MQPAVDVTYSGETAAVHDTWFGGYLGGTAIVDRPVALAADGGPGPVLELGIGTGRVALPLAERGVDVHGVDGSEAMVAQLRAKPGGDADRLIVRLRRFDLVAQRYTSKYLVVEDGRARHLKVRFRHAWPSELDLMARIAGLRLRERACGWGGEPFTGSSPSHVSVYERPTN